MLGIKTILKHLGLQETKERLKTHSQNLLIVFQSVIFDTSPMLS